MQTIPAPLLRLAHSQLGTITRAQLRSAGISERMLTSWVAAGIASRPGPNTVRFTGSRPRAVDDLTALLLDIGGEARASGPTAAALLGFDQYVLRPPFHVTIQRGRAVTRVGHIIHTTSVLPRIDRAVAQGIPCTSGARTFIDLARSETPERLTIAFDSGLRDGRFNERHLHERIVDLRSKGRFGTPKLLAVIDGSEIIRGGHSWLEREFLRLISTAGLPRPETQVALSRAGDRTVRVDARFPGTPVVVEVLGYRFHRSSQQLQRDVERLNALLLDGFLPMQFTYEQIVSAPDQVVEDVRHGLSVSDVRNRRADR